MGTVYFVSLVSIVFLTTCGSNAELSFEFQRMYPCHVRVYDGIEYVVDVQKVHILVKMRGMGRTGCFPDDCVEDCQRSKNCKAVTYYEENKKCVYHSSGIEYGEAEEGSYVPNEGAGHIFVGECFPPSCGKSSSRFPPTIPGSGDPIEAADHSWPWLALVIKPGGFCSAILLPHYVASSKFLLTTASCLKGTQPGQLKVCIGFSKHSTSSDEDCWSVYDVFEHKKFKKDNSDVVHDLAVIMLDYKCDFSEAARAACLPANDVRRFPTGLTCVAAGFTSDGVVMQIVTTTKNPVPRTFKEKMKGKAMDAVCQMIPSKKDRTSCPPSMSGDAAGTLASFHGGMHVCEEENGAWTLYGTISEAAPFVPVADSLGWIHERMRLIV